MAAYKCAEIGKRRHLVTIQVRDDSSTDDYGQPVESWADAVTRMSSIEGLSGTEIQELSQTVGDVSHRLTFPYYSSLTPRHRITFGTRTFNIVYIQNPEQMNVDHVVLCKEKV